MNPDARLAVLIDAENVSHQLADRIFELAESLGKPCVRLIYGDFAGSAKSWESAIARHALEVRHCCSPANGKNGADIALVVGAMDLLRDGTVDGFCIVSSDGDFAALIQRIRKEGSLAFGIGRAATTRNYREGCTRFLTLELPASEAASLPTHPPGPHPALPAIRKALKRCTPDKDGWYHLGAFGNEAKKDGTTPNTFGASKWSDLIKKTGQFNFQGSQLFQPATPVRAVASNQ